MRLSAFSRCFCSVLLSSVALTALIGPQCFSAEHSSDVTTRQNEITRPGQLSEKEVSEGWIALFDDKTDFGWKQECRADWQFDDGVIAVSTGEIGLLRTTCQFDNFILRLDFRATAKTNSGVFIRTSPRPKSPANDCYEINIAANDNPFPTASLVGRKKAKADCLPNKWNRFEITANGKSIKIALNGKPVCEYSDPNALGRGYIGLQHNSGKIEFRNVVLKPITSTKLFDGKDLNKWKTYPALDTKAKVEDNHLNLIGGKGQIETRKSYGDFLLQLQCRTNAAGLNSGVFFRCIPGEIMNGYESQIQNQFRDQRDMPVDCGTGGIFRRQNARWVNADDQEWFTKTVLVTGPHMAVWVNGLQVSDWTDKRKKDSNPRRGLRLEAGTITLQGHDPTTDLSFRDIKVSELLPRRIVDKKK